MVCTMLIPTTRLLKAGGLDGVPNTKHPVSRLEFLIIILFFFFF